ncbi:VWA domain-containing protein [Streptomyces sp. NBC_00250]|uniref:vWA domain-containing protein n=1 Tax=Streptomyces sp. NBC_00250 TaxID=2903641 RepID=UPI002E2DDE68|nr:VWA domain-containing protein [Streptomyces sp. NBC_00250]
MRVRRGTTGGVVAGLFALLLVPAPAAVAETTEDPGGGSLVMVLDSSGSMADPVGGGEDPGRTRMAAARDAVGTVVDGLPDGHPTGLRVYGADRTSGCTDTRLAKPVAPLDRAGLKAAVAALTPRGDTPIGLSLRKAAEDLPEPAPGAITTRTILLISDGEDTCGTPQPCEVAAELAHQGIGLRIDTVGFQVKGEAREQLECVAEAGNGHYYDAPDADALARQLQRAARLSADGYRLRGTRVEGTPARDGAPKIAPGQYLDTIGPGERRYYAVDLDSASTANFAATAVPQPGAAVDTVDKLATSLVWVSGVGDEGNCATKTEIFHQDEGAVPLTSAVSRIPTETRYSTCDKAGRYWLAVERESKPESDAARWPLELVFGVEEPLPAGAVPAQSQPEYGAGGPKATLPTGDPKDVRGGTGFNDAEELGPGVWRDRLLPAQTLWYKVPVGWGQQLRYDVDFANEPTVRGPGSPAMSYGGTEVYTPARHPVGIGTGVFTSQTTYTGHPASLRMGTVPVAWTNRYEPDPNVIPVHTPGGHYIAVTLGADTARLARNPEITVVLRIAVLGEEKAGPEHHARAMDPAKPDESTTRADTGGTGGAGWTGTTAVAVGGGALVLLAGVLIALGRARRRAGTDGRNA